MKMKSLFFALLAALPLVGFAQSAAPENWQHLDKLKDGYMGVSNDKTYSDLLQGKKSQPVVVAVIDGGVDYMHEDLKDVMWKNPGEIAANGKDDDNNGYVDDVYGWNFIGGKDGRNVNHDQLEITRLYAKYREAFKNISDPATLSKKQRKEYQQYKDIESKVNTEREKAAANVALYTGIMESVNQIEKTIGKSDATIKDVMEHEFSDEKLATVAKNITSNFDETSTLKEVKEEVQGGIDYFSGQAEYNYNPDLKVRDIVGDNYANSYERSYGNADVKGPDASHGTHVAGIIAASRNNSKGMDGIADNVKIMAVRCVPDGDERDKDVANSIIYAVDNGASVINMSFGKGYSWDKEAVDKAVKYAMKHDVLLIHAAGNSAQNNDKTDNFPNDKYEKHGIFGKKTAKNWLEVGALSWKGGEDMAANFSNYGKENVDLFAPGVAIYSTIPEGGYARFNGTSMASPVVAGVAALIRSYYPDLSAEQVKDILMSSTVMEKNARVKVPGEKDKVVPFSELCVSGGTVSSYEAMKKAATVKGKKKKSGKNGSGAGNGKDGKKGQA